MKTNLNVFLFAIALVFVGSGCKKSPSACFEYSVDGGIISVWADCSSNENSYLWDFGDADGTAISSSFNYEYENPGTYTVTLQVSGDGGTETTSKSVVIVEKCVSCRCNIPGYSAISFCGTEQKAGQWCAGCVAPSPYSCFCD